MDYDRWLESPYEEAYRESDEQEAFYKWFDDGSELIINKEDDEKNIYIKDDEIFSIKSFSYEGGGDWSIEKIDRSYEVIEEIEELASENTEGAIEILLELLDGDNEQIYEVYKRLKGIK